MTATQTAGAVATGEGAAAPAAHSHPLTITVYGKPITQGSKTKNRYGATYDDNAKTLKPWREAVKQAALDLMPLRARQEGPVCVDVVFHFDRPTGHYRTGRNAHLLRDTAPASPCSKTSGDLDKLVRAVFDALTDAGVWRDDSQVVHVTAEKTWTGTGMRAPGARITIFEAP